MKSLSLENIYLSKESIIRAVSLLNQYKKNKRVNLRKTFEDNLGKYLGAKHSFACNSGTNGLHVALLSLGIKKGEEVAFRLLHFIDFIVQVLLLPLKLQLPQDHASMLSKRQQRRAIQGRTV